MPWRGSVTKTKNGLELCSQELMIRENLSSWVEIGAFGLNVVLIEPEIPPNTGNIARLCLAVGATLHLVKPLGFQIDDRTLKRAGMDYWHQCKVQLWDSFSALATVHSESRFFFFTTKADRVYWSVSYRRGDFLVFGRETRGLPESLLRENADFCVTLPMQPAARSLNLATAVSAALYEAARQLAKQS